MPSLFGGDWCDVVWIYLLHSNNTQCFSLEHCLQSYSNLVFWISFNTTIFDELAEKNETFINGVSVITLGSSACEYD